MRQVNCVAGRTWPSWQFNCQDGQLGGGVLVIGQLLPPPADLLIETAAQYPTANDLITSLFHPFVVTIKNIV